MQTSVYFDSPSIAGSRVNDLFREYQQNTYQRTDQMFAVLMIIQWLAALGAAVWLTPLTWIGTDSQIHMHVLAALFIGTLISFFPVALALMMPGETLTRYVIAIGQMAMGALLIHLSGGRIETHFHIFGSLAFLAFYRDWKVLIPASLIVVTDHLFRGLYYPESIFGVLTASHWRWLEHTGWVVFIDIFLGISCVRGANEMKKFAERTIALEAAERKTALKIGEEKYQELFENANDLIFTHDLDGKITSVNKSGEKITGYSREEAVLMNINQLVAPEYLAYARQMTADIVTNHLPTAYEVLLVTKEGKDVWIEVSTRLIYKNGQPFEIQGIARDITERKRIEAELECARDGALESVRLKSEFLATMSHEIRTPMNGVIGMTGLLLDTHLNDEQLEFTETIRSSADSLLTIINDILDFSKIEAGKLHFEHLAFDLRQTVESTIEVLAQRAEVKNIEMAALIAGNVPTQVMGDGGRLKQVLLNLAGNAVKFTEHGEVTICVTKEEETESHVNLRFEVRDTGIGISKEAQKNLFQPFVQADGSTTRRYGGTGLGLAISRQIIEIMGGEIGIESEPGEGSTFWFTTEMEKQAGGTDELALKPQNDLRDLKVLIVDDNATNRQVLVGQTTSWGMKPIEAENGRQALKLLREAAENKTPFDVALLDLVMPEINGFDLARMIKAEPQISPVRLVLMTSFGIRGDAQEAREIGIAAYLTKPVRQSQLFDCLALIMDQSPAPHPAEEPLKPLITKHLLEENKLAAERCILIAEDNPVNQKIAVRQIQNFGYQADVAGNGLEAIEALTGKSYDIVLMDCQMPEMDGYEATAEIRRREGAAKHTIIIAMTANAMEGDREKCLKAGMDDYISKPVKKGDLQTLLEKYSGKNQAIAAENLTANQMENQLTV